MIVVNDGDRNRQEARYLFDADSLRSANEPPEDSARLIWMFLRLLRDREIDYTRYAKEFRRGTKTFARDIAKLRSIGERYDFTVSRKKHGRVRLGATGDLLESQENASAIVADTLRAVADALGEIVANDVLAFVDTGSATNDPFLRIAAPRLIDGSEVAQTFAILRSAWQKRSRVRFRYPENNGDGTAERIVEPHSVSFYDGRYYLVAYDGRPKTTGWRQFALDRMIGPIVAAGTFSIRTVPTAYRGEDAVGLFKSTQQLSVKIAIAPEIAASVLGRRWQRNQRVEKPPIGWPTITFDVFDIGEAVRWAFGFGENARVVFPPDAVRVADETALAMLRFYRESDVREA